MMKERIDGVKADDIGRPTGAYRVELLDRHTGKTTERIESSNYISTMMLDYLRWRQARDWHRGNRIAHLGGASHSFPTDVHPMNLFAGRHLPVDFIAGLTSSIAEDTSSTWLTGKTTAFASRWKTTIPAGGPRGQINEAQSEMTIDGSKTVYDFNEDQGNGTIASLAICRLSNVGSNIAPPALRIGDTERWFGFNSTELHANYRKVCHADYDGEAIRAWTHTPAQTCTVDVSGVPTVNGVKDLSGITTSDITRDATLASLSFASNTSSYGPTKIYYVTRPQWIKEGLNTYLAFSDYRGYLNLGSWVTSTGAKNWAVTVDTGGSTTSNHGAADLCWLGGKLYVVGRTSNRAKSVDWTIYRIDPTTGATEITIPLGTDANGDPVVSEASICTDGTDLFVGTSQGVAKYDVSGGSFVEWYGYLTNTTWNETGLTPWNTQASYQDVIYTGTGRGPDMTGAFNSSASDSYAANVPTDAPTWREGLRMDSLGRLWISDDVGSVGNVDGGNLFSRSVLGSSISKTSSSTMKWTYEITFPSEWRENATGLVVPPS